VLLHRELAAPRRHLLLCGGGDAWYAGQVAALGERYAHLLSAIA
jgi:hypothetical protein